MLRKTHAQIHMHKQINNYSRLTRKLTSLSHTLLPSDPNYYSHKMQLAYIGTLLHYKCIRPYKKAGEKKNQTRAARTIWWPMGFHCRLLQIFVFSQFMGTQCPLYFCVGGISRFGRVIMKKNREFGGGSEDKGRKSDSE